MAHFKSAAVFLTFDNLSFFLNKSEEHEEERDTRCMVPELGDAVASDGSSHSSLHSSLSSSSAKGRSSRLPQIIHPSHLPCLLSTLCVFCAPLPQLQHARSRFVLSTKCFRNCVHNRNLDNLVMLFNFQILFFQSSTNPRRCWKP